MGLFSKKKKPLVIHSLEELTPLVETGKPILLDFYQVGCGPCKVMDGIVNELAHEYAESAHVVKVDVTKVAGAGQVFKVRSTPTFVLLGRPAQKQSSKSAKHAARKGKAGDGEAAIKPRWRAQGLVKKDQLRRVLEGNGASAVD